MKIIVYTIFLIIYTKSTLSWLVKLSGSSQAVSNIIFDTKTYFNNRVRQKQWYVFNYPPVIAKVIAKKASECSTIQIYTFPFTVLQLIA